MVDPDRIRSLHGAHHLALVCNRLKTRTEILRYEWNPFEHRCWSRQLRITKAGDSDLRRLLVGSAQYILGPFGPDSDLRRWGIAIAARGGKNAKKRAIVAVARKLAMLLHRLWISGATYRPHRDAESPMIGVPG